MSGEWFTLDTNILVHSVDLAAGVRHHLAKTIMNRAALAPCRLTLQAISEFYVVVTRKRLMPPHDGRQVADAMLTLFPSVTASTDAVRTALALAASGRAGYWDALLMATAAEAGCTAILTEDLADGASPVGMRIINPFDGTRLSAAVESLLATDQT